MTTQKDTSLEKQLSDGLIIESNFIQIVNQEVESLDFVVNGVTYYTAKLTKAGKIKKGSIRRDFA